MRLGLVTVLVSALTAAALLPGLAAAAGEHAGGHDEGPTNPLVKQVILYLDGAGALAAAPASAGTVDAGPAMVDGSSTPVAWTVAATRNTAIDGPVYVELYARTSKPTLSVGGPDGAAFRVQLLLNGQPVEGVESLQKLDGTVLQSDQAIRLKVFLPQKPVALAPGDTLGVQVSFYGLNPEAHNAVQYVVGGEQGSRMALRLRMASLDEVMLPRDQVGAWPIAPLEGFDFEAAKKANPGAKVVTLRAFQFGFAGAPVVVPNGTKVILQLYVDESLSKSSEGHAGHDHGSGDAMPWDANMATPLHGFSLQTLDSKLATALFDNLVVTMTFTADKPGNYTFLCTVFCGSGHGLMTDRLTIEGLEPPVDVELGSTGTQGGAGQGPARTPAPAAALGVLALAAVALLARRRA